MGRRFVSIIFILLIMTVLWLLLTRSKAPLNEDNYTPRHDKPRMSFYAAKFYGYKGGSLESYTYASKADLFAHGGITLSGGVRAWRVLPGGIKEKLEAQRGLVKLEGKRILDILKLPKVSEAEFYKNISILRELQQIYTSYVKYDAKTGDVFGDKIVLFRQNKTWFQADQGFLLKTFNDDFELKGSIDGEHWFYD